MAWQSVPSISGKNGILSLVTLDSESINDGEPVSGADVSVFDQVPSNDNNIKNLADTYGSGEASSAVDVTVKYKVTLPPGGVFDILKLVAKKDSEPEDASDGDKVINISANKTKKTVTGLDENSMYYFKIFAEDSNGSTSESNEKHIATSGDEGWSFDYTGEIQTFVAPKTGIYSLETWGSQGGNATDGTNSARGGYGAYAYGEVLLTQGDRLYINVGGQNGYGGGGILIEEKALNSVAKSTDYNGHYQTVTRTNAMDFHDGIYPYASSYFNTDWNIRGGNGDNNGSYITISGDAFVHSNVNGIACFAIPVNLSNVIGVKYSVKLEQRVDDWTGVKIECVKLTSSSYQYVHEALYYRKPTGWGGGYEISDTNWHDYEYSFSEPKTIDYFHIGITRKYGSIKNIVFICKQ